MKIRKIIICFFIIVCISAQGTNIFATNNTTNQVVYGGYDGSDDIWKLARDFITHGENQYNNAINSSDAYEIESFEKIAGILTGLGILVAIGTAIVLGIRFMVSSVGKRAEIKQAIAPFIIGTIIVVGAVTIWKLLINILDV